MPRSKQFNPKRCEENDMILASSLVENKHEEKEVKVQPVAVDNPEEVVKTESINVEKIPDIKPPEPSSSEMSTSKPERVKQGPKIKIIIKGSKNYNLRKQIVLRKPKKFLPTNDVVESRQEQVIHKIKSTRDLPAKIEKKTAMFAKLKLHNKPIEIDEAEIEKKMKKYNPNMARNIISKMPETQEELNKVEKKRLAVRRSRAKRRCAVELMQKQLKQTNGKKEEVKSRLHELVSNLKALKIAWLSYGDDLFQTLEWKKFTIFADKYQRQRHEGYKGTEHSSEADILVFLSMLATERKAAIKAAEMQNPQ